MTFGLTHYMILSGKTQSKGGADLEKGKPGPKTDNPKTYKLTVKLDQESTDILKAYNEQESVSSAETVRRGLKRLKPDLKEK